MWENPQEIVLDHDCNQTGLATQPWCHDGPSVAMANSGTHPRNFHHHCNDVQKNPAHVLILKKRRLLYCLTQGKPRKVKTLQQELHQHTYNI